MIPCDDGSRSGEFGGQKMDALNIDVEEEISQSISVESSDVVSRCRPSGGGKRPAVQGNVCEDRTVRVLPAGTGRCQ